MIKVIQKAAGIIEIVGKSAGPSAFAEIRRRTGLHKATLSHILKSMVETGLLARTPEGSFHVGAALLGAAERARNGKGLIEIAERCVRDLAEELGESVAAARIENERRLTLACANVSRGGLLVDTAIESRPLYYSTATGLIFLAHMPRNSMKAVIARHGLPVDTWPEASTRAKLFRTLIAIRNKGYAVRCIGELEMIAVPVIGPDKKIEAALGCSLPAYRAGSKRAVILRGLMASAARISAELASRGRPYISKHRTASCACALAVGH